MQPEILCERPKIRTIPSTAIYEEGLRLDCNPYTQGAFEAKAALKLFPRKKHRLADLTSGYNGGIFNGPQFKRNYVTDLKSGVPFLTSGSILQADLSDLPLLKKTDAHGKKLSYLQVKPGMTLITCSGSIGRMAYTRPDMSEMWSSQDVIKVQANPDMILSGYLYAYLTSKYGNALITASTYGAVIQHIEPNHIQDLPVPRLDPRKERTIHELIESAANKRSEATSHRTWAQNKIHEITQWQTRVFSKTNTVTSSFMQRRLDASFHSDKVQASVSSLKGLGSFDLLGTIVRDVFEPNRGARNKVPDESQGVPFISSTNIFYSDPKPDFYVSRKSPHLEKMRITECDVLIPRSGSIGGLIGRAVLPLPICYDYAATDHLVRVRCHSKKDAYFLWSILSSQPGYYFCTGTAFGSAIPSLDCSLLKNMPIPRVDTRTKNQVIDHVEKMCILLNEAVLEEHKAIAMVEAAIGGKA